MSFDYKIMESIVNEMDNCLMLWRCICLKDCNVAWLAFLGLFFYYCRIHRIQGA